MPAAAVEAAAAAGAAATDTHFRNAIPFHDANSSERKFSLFIILALLLCVVRNEFFFFSLTAAFSVVAVAYFLRFSRDDWLEFYIPDINSLSFFRTCLWVNFVYLREKFVILYLQ